MWKVDNEMVDDDVFEQVKSEIRKRHLRKKRIKQTQRETHSAFRDICLKHFISF